MNNSELQQQTSSQRVLESNKNGPGQQSAVDNAIFYQQQLQVNNQQNSSEIKQQQNNKRYASKKKGSTQPYGQKQVGQAPQHVGVMSDQHVNLISEGALSQLINSHINEGDAKISAITSQQNYEPFVQAGATDSFENANLAFWTRKQNEYKANLVKQNPSQERNHASVLSNQQRIMTHLMSLDECDLTDEQFNNQNRQVLSNPRSPQGQQKFEGQRTDIIQNQISVHERSDNRSLQLMASGFEPAQTSQNQYVQNTTGVSAKGMDTSFFNNESKQANHQSKAVFMQDQMQHQKRAQSTIRVQNNRDLAQDAKKRDKSTGHPSKGKTSGRATSKAQNATNNNFIAADPSGSGRNARHAVKGADNHTAHLLSNTQSEERDLNTGAYSTATNQNGVRRIKMRQGAPPKNQPQATLRGQSINQNNERQQSRVRVRLQKRNGMTQEISETYSKEDAFKNSSLENVMDAVVSIQGGEIALKGGKTGINIKPYENNNSRLTGNTRKTNTDQSKTADTNKTNAVIPKAPMSSNFESPTKARQFYNKTQTIEENRGGNSNIGNLIPQQQRTANAQNQRSNNTAQQNFSKWADDTVQSPKFALNQIQLQPNAPLVKKAQAQAAAANNGSKEDPRFGKMILNSQKQQPQQFNGYQTSEIVSMPATSANRMQKGSRQIPVGNQTINSNAPSQKTSTITLNRLANEGRSNLSKSIIVNQNRNQIIQSLGRYNDIMSHENFEQEFETVQNEEITDLYHLDDSYDSAVPQQRIAAHVQNKGNQKKTQSSAGDGMTYSGGGWTAATSGNHYFASRHFAASFALDPNNQPNNNAEIDASARKVQTTSGQNALLSLISMDDFEGIRNQIHSKIRDKIDENPASEEEEEHGPLGADNEVVNETSPMHQRLKSRRKAAQQNT